MKYLISIVAALLIAAPAAAQNKPFYIGGSLGQTSVKSWCENTAGTGISCDDKSTSWRLLGGYQINPYFAAEVGYVDIGEVEGNLGTLNVSAKSTIWELNAVGSYPIAKQFSIYGKLGLYHAQTEATSNFGFGDKQSNNDLTYGFGARFDFASNLAARLEWQRYAEVGGGDIGKSDIDVISIGVLFKF